MIRRTIITLLIILPYASLLQARNDTEERISRVEIGLSPPVMIKGDPFWNLQERMEHYGVPGLSVAVIHDFRVVWTKAYGVMDSETGEPVTQNTIFQAASISKTLNATAIMKKVQEGVLSLDEDVNTYLRSWKLPENEHTEAKKVTIANLLSHTGGTTVSGFPGYNMGTPLPAVLQILSGGEPANTPPVIVDIEPGSMYRYSGGGTTILQLLLIELESKPYPQIMKEMVLDPLKMTSSSYSQPLTPELQKLASSAHGRNGEPLEGKYKVYPELAAAGLWTTPADLARFTVEHQLSLQSRSNRILSRDMEEKMTTPYIGETYGLGFGIRNMKDEIYFAHGGGNWGFNCLLIAHKQSGYGAVVMANANGMGLIDEVVRSIAREYSWEGYVYGPYELYAISSDTLRRYAGRYLLDTDQVADVSVEDDHLRADVTGERAFKLYPVSANEFIRRDNESRILFISGSDPGQDLLEIVGNGPARTFPRMGEDEKTPFEHLSSGSIDEAIDRYRELRDSDGSHRAVAERRLNMLGYELLGKGQVKEAIALLGLNVEFYPASANAYDSLGEAYLKNGERDLAIENYKRSLELNPGNSNAARALEEIGE